MSSAGEIPSTPISTIPAEGVPPPLMGTPRTSIPATPLTPTTHLQLANIMVQLQDIKKGKEIQEDLWCIRCIREGHHKDNCSALMNYVAAGAPDPINTQGMT